MMIVCIYKLTNKFFLCTGYFTYFGPFSFKEVIVLAVKVANDDSLRFLGEPSSADVSSCNLMAISTICAIPTKEIKTYNFCISSSDF